MSKWVGHSNGDQIRREIKKWKIKIKWWENTKCERVSNQRRTQVQLGRLLKSLPSFNLIIIDDNDGDDEDDDHYDVDQSCKILIFLHRSSLSN